MMSLSPGIPICRDPEPLSGVILLIWVYYSAQILLLGAEVTHVYANKRGSRVEPVSRRGTPGPEELELSLHFTKVEL